MRIFILLVLILGTTAGCARVQGGLGRLGIGAGAAKRSQVEIEGTRFRARANADSADRRAVTITVTPVAVNPDGAREAGRYEATKYCLLTYGGSDTEWTVSPDQPIEELPVADDTLTLQGRCIQR